MLGAFLSVLISPLSLGLCVLGVSLGIGIGVLPGLNASMGIAILLPLAYVFEPVPAMVFFFGIYAGAIYGGSISAILINAPGTTAAVATSFDGYPLTEKGEAGRALGMALFGSAVGGIVSTIALILLAPQIADFALAFGPPEYFGLMVLGLSLVSTVSTNSPLKSFVGVFIGLLISSVGLDPIIGVPRFNFNTMVLMTGIDFIIVLIGMFALSTVLISLEKSIGEASNFEEEITSQLPSLKDIKRCWKILTAGSILGTIIGALPGAGATISSFANYGLARNMSKHPEEFGKGNIEGVCGAETGNNSAAGGAMIPMLTMGIPGSESTAVMLGALMILGLTPGPLLFEQQGKLVYQMFGGFLLANIIFLIIGLFGIRYFVKILRIPNAILFPTVIIFTVVGSYSMRNQWADVLLLTIFGVVGYLFRKFNFPVGPIVIATVLGPLAEMNLRQSLIMSDGSWTIFLDSPIALVLIVLTFVSFLFPYFGNLSRVKNIKVDR